MELLQSHNKVTNESLRSCYKVITKLLLCTTELLRSHYRVTVQSCLVQYNSFGLVYNCRILIYKASPPGCALFSLTASGHSL